MTDLSKRLDSVTRFRILMKLRTMNPNDRFDAAFDAWVLENYGLHMHYDFKVLTGTEISDEDFTALLLKVSI